MWKWGKGGGRWRQSAISDAFSNGNFGRQFRGIFPWNCPLGFSFHLFFFILINYEWKRKKEENNSRGIIRADNKFMQIHEKNGLGKIFEIEWKNRKGKKWTMEWRRRMRGENGNNELNGMVFGLYWPIPLNLIFFIGGPIPAKMVPKMIGWPII